MNRNHLWKLLLIVFVVAWALYEMYPPKGLDLIVEFQRKSRNRDAAYSNIVERVQQLQKEFPERKFGNLYQAVGTNDLTRYFPNIYVKGEKEPSRFILHRLQREAAGRIKLGLDLQGGSSFLVEMQTNQLDRAEEKESALANAVEVLRKRVDKLGVAEPLIQPSGQNRILIQLPGLSESDLESARRQIEQAAFLEFRMVHPESEKLIAEGIIEPGYEVLQEENKRPDGTKVLTSYLVSKKPERGLTGKFLKRAGVSRHHLTNKPEIDFELDSQGAELFAQITREYGPKGNKFYQLAIVLDGDLKSAPTINEPIEGGRGQISGTFDINEAIELANVLENPLEVPVKIIEQRTVDPSLGKDSIQSGVRSALIGTIAVAAFMALYYLFSGMVANMAVALNMVILMGVLCSVEATLTLPGIAGIVLTVGMAVDANVLIFERIREERAAGKSMRGALAAGYDKAFGTIFDSNLTTLISAVILIFMGTGPVKGFGVTLSIGIATSMFTALVVTRLIFDWMLARGWLRSLPMLQFVKETHIDFLRWAIPAFALSWLLIVAGIGYGIHRGSDVLGHEFAGGDKLTLEFAQKLEVEKVRDAIAKLGVGDALIQYQKDLATGKETLNITAAVDAGEKIQTELAKTFPAAGFSRLSFDQVGPSVGKEILRVAIISILLALLGILVYVAFRYELSFAVGAIIAILHDVLMTLGWFFLTGRELSAPMVAAILTIIGFSINDTIVIFDRIREDLKLGVRGSFKDIMNIAINQTLSRTIITSGTVLIATLSLYIFGGPVINDFAFTFLVGILTGTYSTIYIASAIVLWWHKGEKPSTGSGVRVSETVAAPARI